MSDLKGPKKQFPWPELDRVYGGIKPGELFVFFVPPRRSYNGFFPQLSREPFISELSDSAVKRLHERVREGLKK